MPLKRMLGKGRSYDPKAVAILMEAFNGVVAELGLRTPAEREEAAKLIIRVAHGQPGLDAAKLRSSVIKLM